MQLTLAQIAACMHTQAPAAEAVVQGVAIDSRQLKAGDLFVALPGKQVDGHDYVLPAAAQGAVAALVTHDVADSPIPLLIVPDVVQALGQLAHWWRQQHQDCRLVAITGSCGKSTTKAILQHILTQQAATHATKGNYNNHLGVPLTLLGIRAHHRYVVVEMGADKAGEINDLTRMAAPDVAVITTIAEAHLEGFGGLDGVAQAKAEIVHGLVADGTLVVNADVARCQLAIDRCLATQSVYRWGHAVDVACQLQAVDETDQGLVVTCRFAKHGVHRVMCGLHGAFNASNIAAALSVGVVLGLPIELLVTACATVVPMPRRMQPCQGYAGATIIDDAYNANPTAMKAAIDALQAWSASRKILVLGDMMALGERADGYHAEVGAQAKAAGIHALYAVGELCRQTVTSFGEGAYHYTDQAALISALRGAIDATTVVLIKGSHASGMQAVVQALLLSSDANSIGEP